MTKSTWSITDPVKVEICINAGQLEPNQQNILIVTGTHIKINFLQLYSHVLYVLPFGKAQTHWSLLHIDRYKYNTHTLIASRMHLYFN